MPMAAALAVDAVGSVAVAVLHGLVSVARNFNPYDHTYYSMPKLRTAAEALRHPAWRLAMVDGAWMRVGAALLPRLALRPAAVRRHVVVRVLVLAASAAVTSASLRLSSAMTADRSGALDTTSRAWRYTAGTQRGVLRGIFGGTPFAFAALLLEHEIGPLIGDAIGRRAGTAAGAVVNAMLPLAITPWLWDRADAYGLRDPKNRATYSRLRAEYRLAGRDAMVLMWSAASSISAALAHALI
jgi:hypothetical protein